MSVAGKLIYVMGGQVLSGSQYVMLGYQSSATGGLRPSLESSELGQHVVCSQTGMDVNARKHETPDVLPWIPPGQSIEETTKYILTKKSKIFHYILFIANSLIRKEVLPAR